MIQAAKIIGTGFATTGGVKKRGFHTTTNLAIQNNSDNDELREQLDQWELESKELRGEVDEVRDEILGWEKDNRDDDDVESHATTFVKSSQAKIESLTTQYNTDLGETSNVHDEKTLLVEYLKSTMEEDKSCLEGLQVQLATDNLVNYDTHEIVDKLNSQLALADELQDRLDIKGFEDSPASFPQDSSDVVDTDFSSFDPFEE